MALRLSSKEADQPLNPNRFEYYRTQPGPVHSVGDSVGGIRLKHSHPDLPLRWDKHYSGKKVTLMGDNNSDGDHVGFFTPGMGEPYVNDNKWPGGRDFKTPLGWYQQDLRPEDKAEQPLLSSTPNATWDRKVAEVYSVYRPGFNFLPLPGGYQPSPGEIPRGGNVPQLVAVVGDPDFPEVTDTMGSLNKTGYLDPRQIGGYSGDYANRIQGLQLPRPGRRFFAASNTRGIRSR